MGAKEEMAPCTHPLNRISARENKGHETETHDEMGDLYNAKNI